MNRFPSSFCAVLGCPLFRAAALLLLFALFAGSVDIGQDYPELGDNLTSRFLSVADNGPSDNCDRELSIPLKITPPQLPPMRGHGHPITTAADILAIFSPEGRPPSLS